MRWLLIPALISSCWHEPAPAKPADPPKQPIVKDIVQPVRIEKVEREGGYDPCGGDPCGDPCGVAGGVVGDVAGPPPPPPPPPAPPQNVAPTLLEGFRLAGEKNIQPDDVTKVEIQRSGKDRILASLKMCVNVSGDVSSVNLLKSSGFGAYDTKIQREMARWKYKPYQVNGRAVPVCTAVTFIYSQAAPPPPPPPPPKP